MECVWTASCVYTVTELIKEMQFGPRKRPLPEGTRRQPRVCQAARGSIWRHGLEPLHEPGGTAAAGLSPELSRALRS